MTRKRFLKRLRIVRNATKEDLLYFVLPAFSIFIIELLFCARDGLTDGWAIVADLIKQPSTLVALPAHALIGLTVVLAGFAVVLVAQISLGRNVSPTVIIHESHQLVTHGIYRFTRNPMYLGMLKVAIGLPVFVASWSGFLTSLVLIPIILVRIRLEERLLSEEFGNAYREYCEKTGRLIPFIRLRHPETKQ